MVNGDSKHSVIIVAGGKGLRAGSELPKQFCEIGGKPMLMYAIEAFYKFDNAISIVLVLPETYLNLWEEIREKYNIEIPCTIAIGGETRFHSVKNGLEKIPEDSIVGIHDAARPFVSTSVITNCYRIAKDLQCGVIPVTDEKNSMRFVNESGSEILDRTRVKIVQTPQVFPARLLKNAYRTEYNNTFTDDASVAEQAEIPIFLAKGDEFNLKITTPFDMLVADLYLRETTK